MTVAKERWIDNKRLEIIKVFQIQRIWLLSSNPEFKLGKKSILNVYDE